MQQGLPELEKVFNGLKAQYDGLPALPTDRLRPLIVSGLEQTVANLANLYFEPEYGDDDEAPEPVSPTIISQATLDGYQKELDRIKTDVYRGKVDFGRNDLRYKTKSSVEKFLRTESYFDAHEKDVDSWTDENGPVPKQILARLSDIKAAVPGMADQILLKLSQGVKDNFSTKYNDSGYYPNRENMQYQIYLVDGNIGLILSDRYVPNMLDKLDGQKDGRKLATLAQDLYFETLRPLDIGYSFSLEFDEQVKYLRVWGLGSIQDMTPQKLRQVDEIIKANYTFQP